MAYISDPDGWEAVGGNCVTLQYHVNEGILISDEVKSCSENTF